MRKTMTTETTPPTAGEAMPTKPKRHWLVRLLIWSSTIVPLLLVGLALLPDDGVGCSDPEVVKLANQLYDQLPLAGSQKIDVSTITTRSSERGGKSLVCTAAIDQATMTYKRFFQITYTVEVTDRGDQFVVNLVN
jgi:hypothetical protein